MSCRKIASLKGHTQPVLALALQPASSADSTPSLFASAADDGTVRCWDLVVQRSIRAYIGFGTHVNSVVFSSSSPSLLFCAAGRSFHAFDFRSPTVVSQSSAAVFSALEYAQDEINQVVVNEEGTILATVDDSGSVGLYDLRNRKPGRPMRSIHTNICSSVSFHPHRPHELWTGGMDSQIVKWDISSGAALGQFDTVRSEASTADNSRPQQINPPFVQSLTVLPTRGNIVVAGLGDGALFLIESAWSRRKGNLDHTTRRLSGPHSWSIGAVHPFPVRDEKRKLVLSGGLDGYLVLWDLGRARSAGEAFCFRDSVGRKGWWGPGAYWRSADGAERERDDGERRPRRLACSGQFGAVEILLLFLSFLRFGPKMGPPPTGFRPPPPRPARGQPAAAWHHQSASGYLDNPAGGPSSHQRTIADATNGGAYFANPQTTPNLPPNPYTPANPYSSYPNLYAASVFNASDLNLAYYQSLQYQYNLQDPQHQLSLMAHSAMLSLQQYPFYTPEQGNSQPTQEVHPSSPDVNAYSMFSLPPTASHFRWTPNSKGLTPITDASELASMAVQKDSPSWRISYTPRKRAFPRAGTRGYKGTDGIAGETAKCSTCNFEGEEDEVELHEFEAHSMKAPKKAKKAEDPEEIARWIEQRKKNYPTDANIARKKVESEERERLGMTRSDAKTDGDISGKKAGQAMCKYFLKGRCTNGANCRFSHESQRNVQTADATKTKPRQTFRGKRQNLRKMLLASQIRWENQVLLQCIRYIVTNEEKFTSSVDMESEPCGPKEDGGECVARNAVNYPRALGAGGLQRILEQFGDDDDELIDNGNESDDDLVQAEQENCEEPEDEGGDFMEGECDVEDEEASAI
ncbi:WD40-repeat-containing domain protein [Zopfochytrium polystomum]|nr:WD40-repeat-containing domain protein [Zopfochytrium polystomum]